MPVSVETVLDSMPDAFYALDADWRFTHVNRLCEEYLQMTPSQLLGHTLWELFPTILGTPVESKFRRAFADKVAVSFETFSEVTHLWVEVRAFPSPKGLLVYFRNITERRNFDQVLQDSEARFRALADNISQLAWMADGAGNIFWYNRRWFDYTDTTLEEMQGWGWQKVHHPDHLERVSTKVAEHFRQGWVWEDTFPLRGGDGRYRWFLSRASPIRDEAGAVVLWCGTNTDITEQREANEERERLLHGEQQARSEAEALAAALQAQRDQLEESNAQLQSAFLQVETARNELARQREHLAAVARYLRAANRTSALVASAANRTEMARAVVQLLRGEFMAFTCGIWLYDEKRHRLHVEAEWGMEAAPTPSLEVDVEVNLSSYKLGWVARFKRPFVSNQLGEDMQIDQVWIARHGITAAAFFPLTEGTRLLGVMALFTQQALPLEIGEVLTSVATALSNGLAKSRSPQSDLDEAA